MRGISQQSAKGLLQTEEGKAWLMVNPFQASSAQVPDQSHPEKYLNHNHDHLIDVVEHNLWYKQTKQFKHHHHGEKLRVIPHIAPPAPGGPAQWLGRQGLFTNEENIETDLLT